MSFDEKRTKNHIGKLCKILIVFCGFLLVFCAAFSPCDVAFADEKSQEEVEKQLSDVVNSVLDSLDLDALKSLIQSLSSESSEALKIDDIKQEIKNLLSGNGTDFFERIFNLLSKAVGRYFLSFLPSFVTIILLCLLKSMLASLTGDFLNGSTTQIVHIVCYISIVIVLSTGIMLVVKEVSDTINVLAKFAEVIFPLLLGLLSSLGAVSAAGGYTPLTAVLGNLIIKIVTSVVLPAFIASIVFCVVGGVSKSVKLDKLTKLVRSSSTWLIGIVFSLFASFLALQGVSGGISDKFGFGVAKFAISSYVPILGGYLSDGFDVLTASIVLVKNAVGYTGAIVLCATVVFPIVKVVVFSLTLKLCAAIAEPIGDECVAILLSDVAKNVNLLITALAGVAFLFFLMLMLIIGTCNFGV